MARVLLCTFGSLGDLHPYLAIGRGLALRAHSVVVATFAAYRERVEAAGLAFHAARPAIDPNDKEQLRRAMDRRTGTEYILRDVAFGHVRENFEDCRDAAQGADLIVTHPVAYGALLAARASGRRWASVALAPISLFSTTDPCVYAQLPFGDLFASFGPGFQRALLRLVDRGTSRWQNTYRELEQELGLTRGPNPVLDGQHSPHLVLALFSRELAPPQPDWPSQTRITGFPLFSAADGVPNDVRSFIDAGDPPIVFTLGSAAVGAAGDFFTASARAARTLGMRALLLVGHDAGNMPRGALPDGVLAVPYAPHARVFARASIVVHQGGIGTTGEAMRAGIPMLVVPYGHDQPDQARRLRRLGIARSIAPASYNARTAARAIAALRDDAGAARRAAAIGERVRSEDGVGDACDALEQLL